MSATLSERLTAEQAKALGFVRRHNGIGWFWCRPGGGFDTGTAETTRQARERGDLPPEEQPDARRAS